MTPGPATRWWQEPFLHFIALGTALLGVYQIGDVQARSCTVGETRLGGGTPSFFASYVDQRGVGICSTRT